MTFHWKFINLEEEEGEERKIKKPRTAETRGWIDI